MRRLATAFVLACVPTARAQSVYLDFGPAGSPAGTAPATYGGPASAPGTWNAVSTNGPTGLVSADGSATAVTVALDFLVPTIFGSDDQASGADEALLDDHVRADTNVSRVDFAGLAPGEYVAHTVVVQSTNMWAMSVGVPGSPDPQQWCGGEWSGAYVRGSSLPGNFNDQHGNYALHSKVVVDGTLRVEILAMGFVDQAHVRGLQLLRIDEHAVPLCFGDASSATACPCANAGANGRGCANSASGVAGVALGARVYASGTAVPDTLVLHAESLLPSATSIVLQGSVAVVPPAVFGDGLRCAGGVLKRLYVKSAGSGIVHAPEPGDPSISARSAALGDPIPVGERRYYQVYYRDPDLAFCAAPAGSTFNATNALKVQW